jgi:hypothetical protein
MSPGSVTERLHFYAPPYSPEMRMHAGGGVADEGEDIEAVELEFTEALDIIADGRIADAKTIMLLQWHCAVRSPPEARTRERLRRSPAR